MIRIITIEMHAIYCNTKDSKAERNITEQEEYCSNPILVLKALKKLLGLCVLLVGFIHLAVELRCAGTVWV